MNPFKRFNIWYDKLREPKRFLLFLGSLLLWYVPLIIAERTGSLFFLAIGSIGLTLMMCCAITRI